MREQRQSNTHNKYNGFYGHHVAPQIQSLCLTLCSVHVINACGNKTFLCENIIPL